MTRPQNFTRSRHPDAAPDAGATRARTGRTPTWRRYVAVGDSFTEGLWDLPDGTAPERSTVVPTGVCRGWADLLAGHLAERAASGRSGAEPGAAPGSGPRDAAPEPFRYANLAVRGRLLGPIVREQVPAALALGPDLVSVVGGGNDLLRPAADPDHLAAQLDDAVGRLRAAGVDVLLATGMDVRNSPVIRRTRSRVAVFNAHVWSIARRHDAHVLDVWGMRSLHDWRMWAPDRIHLTTEGHRRVAQAALVALGLEPDDERWDDPLAPLPPLPVAERVRQDAGWLRDHAYPWATRRLRRRSSGDERLPKQPELQEVPGA